MAAVATSLDPSTGGVKVTLTAPADNADPISAYKIEVAHGGSWSEELTNCDGSTSAVRTSLLCIIPMSALRAAPFNLAYGQLVQVRAQALNSYGWGDVSDAAGALTVRTEPLQMAAPARGARTSTTLVHATWTAVTAEAARGGASITSYHL